MHRISRLLPSQRGIGRYNYYVTRCISSVRGMPDLLGEDRGMLDYIGGKAEQLTRLYGYDRVSTPVLERTQVFSRTLGTDSDIVGKEMYTFEDKSGDQVTLRPELTAPVMRAVLQQPGLLIQPRTGALRYFYCEPMFRYERPQKGRYRQFHQIGVEHLADATADADVDTIAVAFDTLRAVGLEASDFTLELNFLGSAETRVRYNEILGEYLTPMKDELSPLSQTRLERGNALRILDSKDEADIAVIAQCPEISDVMSETDHAFSDAVQSGLDARGIPFSRSPKLVRGLDYYTHTIFEFIPTQSESASHATLLAGGRYDSLALSLQPKARKPKSVPAVGWAAGVERLRDALTIKHGGTGWYRPCETVVVYLLDAAGTSLANQAVDTLRSQGQRAVIDRTCSNVKKAVTRASRLDAVSSCVFIGSHEVEHGTVTRKDLASGTQTSGTIEDVLGSK